MTRKSKREIERTVEELEATTGGAVYDRELTAEDREVIREFYEETPPAEQQDILERLHEKGPIDPERITR